MTRGSTAPWRSSSAAAGSSCRLGLPARAVPIRTRLARSAGAGSVTAGPGGADLRGRGAATGHRGEQGAGGAVHGGVGRRPGVRAVGEQQDVDVRDRRRRGRAAESGGNPATTSSARSSGSACSIASAVPWSAAQASSGAGAGSAGAAFAGRSGSATTAITAMPAAMAGRSTGSDGSATRAEDVVGHAPR